MVPGREGVMVFLGISVMIQVRMKGGTLETQERKRDIEAVPSVLHELSRTPSRSIHSSVTDPVLLLFYG